MIELEPGRLARPDAELGSLAHAPSGGALLALQILPSYGSRLLRGAGGEVCILIASQQAVRNAGLKLRNVVVQSAVNCVIESPDGVRQEVNGTLVTCRATDPMLRQLFLSVMEDTLRGLGSSPSNQEIAAWLQRLAFLFAKLEQEGRKKLRGLWAELAAMIALGNPQEAARRWHSDPSETFDFTAGAFGVEVKSCQDLSRIHQFSLSQLRPPPDQTVWLMSIVVRADPHGATVLELLAEVEDSIQDVEIRGAVRAMALSIGGQALEEDHLHRFDRAGALSTARFIDVRAVPSISEELPPIVRSVKLEIECRDLQPAGSATDALARMMGA